MLNPGVLREREFEITPALRTKRVMVAGGGLAGMEAAKVCAQRGHHVTLYEKNSALGGQWNIASQQEHKGHFATVTRRLRQEMDQAVVRVVLNTEVTKELLRKQNPDALIVATGAAPASLKVRGATGENVVQANDVICGNADVGDKVVVIGGRYVGMELAVTLSQKGKDVSLLTRRKVGRNVRKNIRLFLMEQLVGYGVKLYPDSEAVEIRPNGVIAVCEGNLFFLRADTVILAVGATPENTLIGELKSAVSELHAIGDCVEPRDALAAVKQGAEVGRIV